MSNRLTFRREGVLFFGVCKGCGKDTVRFYNSANVASMKAIMEWRMRNCCKRGGGNV